MCGCPAGVAVQMFCGGFSLSLFVICPSPFGIMNMCSISDLLTRQLSAMLVILVSVTVRRLDRHYVNQ
jgi:hypothetical protein